MLDGWTARVRSCAASSPAHLNSSVARWYSNHASSIGRSASGAWGSARATSGAVHVMAGILPRRSAGKHDLAEDVAPLERRERFTRFGHRQDAVDDGADPRGRAQVEQLHELAPRAHRRADDLQLREEDTLQLGR